MNTHKHARLTFLHGLTPDMYPHSQAAFEGVDSKWSSN
ncbi:hypothetical protein L552_1476 [Bordetella pertussis I002]|nr:hypothetical protein L552_1476 [Bordetella pertussis I002]